MKIVVFTCSTGGGHNSCAKYIAEEFNKYGIHADVEDYMLLAGDKASSRAEKLYLGSTKGNGNIFKTVYKLGELYNKTGIKSPVYAFNKMVVKKLDKFLLDNSYDLAIGTHVFPCMALTELKKKRNIKFINVATDYECIPFWNETNPDVFVIPSNKLIDRFVEKGINKDVLLPIGIPVASSFFEVKNDLDLPSNKDIILLTSGSMGFGEMENCVLKILNDIDAYLVAVCGSNIELKKKLDSIDNDNLIVKGFINNMNEYMNKANVIIAKPGGLTSTEITMMRKPFVLMMPIPGVENYNASFFENNKMAVRAKTLDEVVSLTKKILLDKTLQEEMINNQAKYINRNSAKDLVDYVIENYKGCEDNE